MRLHPVIHIQRQVAVRRIGDLNQTFDGGADAHGVRAGFAGGAGAESVNVGGVFAAQGASAQGHARVVLVHHQLAAGLAVVAVAAAVQ